MQLVNPLGGVNLQRHCGEGANYFIVSAAADY